MSERTRRADRLTRRLASLVKTETISPAASNRVSAAVAALAIDGSRYSLGSRLIQSPETSRAAPAAAMRSWPSLS